MQSNRLRVWWADVWRHLVAAHANCCQCCCSRPASILWLNRRFHNILVFMMINLLSQVLRFDPHQNTFILMYSRWNASGSSALTDITNTSSILTAAPFSFNPSEELKPLWIISDFHVYSFDLFCLLFVIVFQLIYGRCAPSHTRPRTCPHHHSSDNTCSFCLCLCSFDIPSWHCAHGPKTLRTMKPQGEIKSERWWENTS